MWPAGPTELIVQLTAVIVPENDKVAEEQAQWERDHPQQVYRGSPQQGHGFQNPSRSTCNSLLAGGNEMIAGMSGCNPFGY
jgi:hypothetical protein